jgi:uncharacterized membrane protein
VVQEKPVAACTQCGVEIPETISFCPACGNPVAGAKPLIGTTGGIRDKIAAALAYTFVGAIIFLLVERFKKNRFIRFHSFQSIFLVVVGVAIGIALRLTFVVLSMIPLLGQLLVLLISMGAFLGGVILWMVLLVKALQGEVFKLPFIGDLAEKQAIRL